MRNPTNQPTSLQVVKIPNMFHVLLSLPGEVGALSEICATQGMATCEGQWVGQDTAADASYLENCLMATLEKKRLL